MSIPYTVLSYLSGNVIIAFIFLISNVWDVFCHKGEIWVLTYSIILLLITTIATIILIRHVKRILEHLSDGNGGNHILLAEIKQKNIFSTGVMSYYVLPFASFVSGDDVVKNCILLTILLIVFGLIYVRERMILYTPIFSMMGYMVITGIITDTTGKKKIGGKDVLIKSPNNLILGDSYNATVQAFTDTTNIGFIERTKS
jgi:hypothetical protein